MTHALYGLLSILGIIAVSCILVGLRNAVIAYAQRQHDLSDQLAHGDIPHLPFNDFHEGSVHDA
jgi:hypothetical protein